QNSNQLSITMNKKEYYISNGVLSTYLYDNVHVGYTIESSATSGLFTLTEEDAPVAFISGGVGITPMLSMFEQLIDEKSTRDITFLHAAQNEKLHAFHEDVKEMVAAAENAKYVYG